MAQLLPADLVVVAALSVLFAQNGGKGKLQDHASIPYAVRSTDFSPENLCGKELRNPWLVREPFSVAIGRRYPCKLFGPQEKSKHNSGAGHLVFLSPTLLYCRKETAIEADSRTAVCIEQEQLLKESPQALAEFNEHLAGVLTANIGGRKWGGELRKRQAKYAKAYLQFTKPGPQ